MAEIEKMRSKAELEKELETLKLQMQKSGLKVPKTVEGTHKYSGKEEKFKGKSYAFVTGCLKLRLAPTRLGMTKEAAADIYDEKGFLICEKAIKNAKAMNALIERETQMLQEIEPDAPKNAPKGAPKK